MGLIVHSLENIPKSTRRKYFIYLLDYGWHEPISEALNDNFENMADRASKTNAVIIKGTRLEHFENEVLSWHHIIDPCLAIDPYFFLLKRIFLTVHTLFT